MSTVNRSQLIREALTERPAASTADIITMVKRKGTKVSAGLVSVVKSKMTNGKQPAKPVGRTVTMPTPMPPTMAALQRLWAITDASSSALARNMALEETNGAVATIRKVKTLAADVGGMPTLKAVLEAICE